MRLNSESIRYLNNCSIKKFMRNYEFLGEGIARKVFALDDKYVIKVAKNEDGYHQNFVERDVYSNCSDRIKLYLCPIYYSNDRIIIMARAMPYNKIIKKQGFVNPEKFIDDKYILRDLNYLINNFYLYREDIFSARSWGIIDGKFYLIDFGCTSDYGDRVYDDLKEIYYKNKERHRKY